MKVASPSGSRHSTALAKWPCSAGRGPTGGEGEAWGRRGTGQGGGDGVRPWRSAAARCGRALAGASRSSARGRARRRARPAARAPASAPRAAGSPGSGPVARRAGPGPARPHAAAAPPQSAARAHRRGSREQARLGAEVERKHREHRKHLRGVARRVGGAPVLYRLLVVRREARKPGGGGGARGARGRGGLGAGEGRPRAEGDSSGEGAAARERAMRAAGALLGPLGASAAAAPVSRSAFRPSSRLLVLHFHRGPGGRAQ
jgi:hypothetical protein